jgi:sulfide:quinone oxidoreductase
MPAPATSQDRSSIASRNIVIVGGGVGAVEALLALTDLSDRYFDITVVAPNDRFALRALTVAEPFAAGHHADVASLVEVVGEMGATLVKATVARIDTDRKTVVCADGDELHYDTLVLSPGARARQAYDPALTFGLRDPLALNGIVADLEQGYTDSVAFVVPEGVSWPLPLYELALMTARQVHGMNRDVGLSLFTPEPAPLAIFGPEASAAVAELLAEANIALHCGAPVTVARGRVMIPSAGLHVDVERIVSLPVLDGPHLTGVPANSDGFIPVDEYCRVAGVDNVYAIGDATDLLVKQGGLACQQADVAARHIAHEAGGPLPAETLKPVLRGRLLTGGADRFLRRDLAEVHGTTNEQELWWPPAKVYGRYLGPWVANRQLSTRPTPEAAEPEGVDIEVPLRPGDMYGPRRLLGLDPLGAMHD